MLANRFSYANKREISHNRPLTEIEMREVAPSIFAVAPHESRSARYAYIPTIDVLNGLRREGFEPFSVTQSRSRIPGKSEFTKHMIRLRHADRLGEGGSPEIVLLNSHDGTSSYQMLAGWFEFLCSNGLVRGDKAGEIRIPHKGDIITEVVQGAHNMLGALRETQEQREAFRGIALSREERLVFAEAALELRYDEGKALIQPDQVILPRRREETKNDLWTTFNVAQENLIRGGQRGRNANNHRVRTREIQGIDGSVKLNRALWTLAEKMAELKNAA